MRTIARADAALSDIFNQPIQLTAKIGWKWGHLTNNNSLVFLCPLARADFLRFSSSAHSRAARPTISR